MQDKQNNLEEFYNIEQESTIVNEVNASNVIINKKPASSNKTKKIIILSIVSIVVLILSSLLLIPLFLVGSFSVGCTSKMKQLEKFNNSIYSKLQSIEGAKDIKAVVNGDCLTGSGSSFTYSYQMPFDSTNDAINATFNKYKELGLPTPSSIADPEYIFGRYDSTQGGDTPIKQIDVEFLNYTFTIELDKVINCEVITENQVYCNGTEKDLLIRQILQTIPISKIKVGGDIDSY